MTKKSYNSAGEGHPDTSGSLARDVSDLSGHWAGLFQSIPNIIFTTDTDLIIQQINRTVPSLTPEDVIGKSAYDFVNPSDIPEAKAIIEKVLSTGLPESYEIPAKEDIQSAHYAVSVGPIVSEGKVSGLTFVLTDITSLRRTADDLHAGESRLRQVIDLVPHYIFAKDEDGRFLLANEAMARAYGMTVEEIVGRLHQELHPETDEVRRMRADDLEVIRQGKAKYIPEEPFTESDGSRVWLQTIKIPYTEAGTSKPAVLGVAIDITERKKVEEQLRENQHRLMEAQRIARLGNWHYDYRTEVLIWSNEVFRIMGLDPAEVNLSRDTFIEMIHPEDRELFRLTGRNSLENGGTYTVEYRIVRPTGEIRHILQRSEVVLDDLGKPLRGVGTVQDITERKKTMLALQESETRMQMLTSQTPAVLWSVDKDLRYTYSSGSGLQHMGLKPNQVVGMDLFEFFDTDDRQFLPIRMHLKAMTGRPEMYNFDWADRSYQVNLAPLYNEKTGSVDGCIGVALDITERVNTERALAESEERLKLATEAARDGVIDWVPAENRITVNESFADILGMRLDEIPRTYHEFRSLVHPDDLSVIEAARKELQVAKDTDFNQEFRIRHATGKWIWVLAKGSVVASDKHGNPVRFAGTIKEITARKEAEIARADSMERLEATFNALPDLFFEIDDKGTIVDYRTPKPEMLYFKPEEFLNKSLREIFPRDVVATITRAIGQASEEGSHHGSVYSLKYPDDDVRWFELSLAAKKGANGSPTRFVALVRDITARYRTEEKLKETTAQLRAEREELVKKNIALSQILDHLDKERADYKRTVSQNVELAVKDILDRIRRRAGDEYRSEIDSLETQLSGVLSKDVDEFSRRLSRLTPREYEICSLIRKGLSSKEISDQLNLSLFTVHKHREQIRKKLGITNKDINLNTYLKSRNFPSDT